MFGRITTITANRLQGTLTVSRHSLVLHAVKEYALAEVAGVEIARSRSTTSSRSRRLSSRNPPGEAPRSLPAK